MRSYEQYCALARALDHVGQRWTLLIARELLLGPKRFTDLRDGLPGIANNLLAERLRQLQADGLIVPFDLPAPASGRAYRLTDAGAELAEAVYALIRWGGRWMLAGQGDDAFRPGWLALALDALGCGTRGDDDTAVDLVVDGHSVPLLIRHGRVTTREAEGRSPNFIVHAAAEDLLALAAGAISRDAVMNRVTLRPNDGATRDAFLNTFAAASA